jgi:hypothetical protein
MVDALSQRTGLPREQVTAILSQVLPPAVDKLTPHGRLPTHEELHERRNAWYWHQRRSASASRISPRQTCEKT